MEKHKKVNQPPLSLRPLQVQEKIDGITRLDRMLYFAGQEEYEKVCVTRSRGSHMVDV